MGRGVVMTGSASAGMSGQTSASLQRRDIKARREMPIRAEADAVVVWIRGCDVAWIVRPTKDDADTWRRA
jgi:hypothetical protein